MAGFFAASLLGIVADIAELGVVPTLLARGLLIAVVLTGLVVLAVKIWQVYYEAKVRELRKQVAVEAERVTLVRAAHQRCLEAIERISERERPLYSETLEVTINIGTDDESDLIVERRVTTPEPLVTNRTMRPIVPMHGEQIATLEAIGFRAYRADGEITLIPVREQINKLKVWLVFDPPIHTKTEWRVEYRPKELWGPFRRRGFDTLHWDDRLQTANGAPSAFTSFTAIFRFPPSTQQPTVKEQNGYGQLMGFEQKSDRTWEVTWRDDQPAGRRYGWDFAQPGGGVPRQ
ncbi:hypothetical protein [Actinoplanes derwentensis]|uniref:Uncharacterized protein n=1 Tax=Actinoplanes derwentensis TaxID=113562 RepID=A0A1H1YA62_9ACTN|nr:hypothetical protein [Actinoplanes derwentensis]SDT18291.1 hypothetical protein SAMN04489716_2771 [Actinoplanes derwentensis]